MIQTSPHPLARTDGSIFAQALGSGSNSSRFLIQKGVRSEEKVAFKLKIPSDFGELTGLIIELEGDDPWEIDLVEIDMVQRPLWVGPLRKWLDRASQYSVTLASLPYYPSIYPFFYFGVFL